MPENYSFRSSMNGFNRNDVIAYIDTLIQEKLTFEVKIAKLEQEITELKSDNEALRAVIDNESEKTNNSDKCAECDIAKVYEARLGAAMLDAKRFSEILVKEANDKAAGLFAEAYSAVEDTSVKAKEISQNISDINNQFNSAFKVLFDNINSLGRKLDGFKKEVKSTGGMCNFTTQFDDSSTANNDSFANSDVFAADSLVRKNGFAVEVSKGNNVNFDDADEYDFRVDVND